jgi:putative membrane protein
MGMSGSRRVIGRTVAVSAAVLAAWAVGPAASAYAAPARPVTAPQPDPFGGRVPGDVTDGNGVLPPVNNPPGSGPVLDKALPGANPVQTRFGVIDDTDRVFLVKVRQAGLWERPTCLRAQQQSTNERMKEICRLIADDHAQLDEEGRFIALQLNVAVPNQPSADQQAWMREFWLMRGHDFDVTAVKWLRSAHGGVYSAIASVRANTRNDMMRLFAERANTMVNKHMSLLESTGLVQYDSLPHAAIGAPAVALAAAKQPVPKDPNMFRLPVAALLVVTGLIAVVSIRRVIGGS